MSENGEIYTAGKNFTLPPAVTAVTNLTSGEKVNRKKGDCEVGVCETPGKNAEFCKTLMQF